MAKILAILQIPPPSHGAGFVGQQIHDSEFINSNFKVDYVRISTKSKNGKFQNKGFQILRYIYLLFRVTRCMFKHYDLVYITPCASGFEFYKDFIICQLAKIFNKKVVYHFHNKGLANNRRVPGFVKRIFFKNVDVILLSPLLKYDLCGLVTDDRIYYCPNGIDSDVSGLVEVKKNDTLTLLFLSNMIRSKGLFDLLEACNQLHRKGIDFICRFVGPWFEDLEEEFFSKVTSYGLNSNIEYLGSRYGLEKVKVFLETDLFVFPTYYSDECFPLVLLEAMSFKLPVISTEEGAIPDIIRHQANGLIVPKNDIGLLADSIELILSDPLLRRDMSECSYQIYKNHFTKSHFEHRFVEVIKKIAGI